MNPELWVIGFCVYFDRCVWFPGWIFGENVYETFRKAKGAGQCFGHSGQAQWGVLIPFFFPFDCRIIWFLWIDLLNHDGYLILMFIVKITLCLGWIIDQLWSMRMNFILFIQYKVIWKKLRCCKWIWGICIIITL